MSTSPYDLAAEHRKALEEIKQLKAQLEMTKQENESLKEQLAIITNAPDAVRFHSIRHSSNFVKETDSWPDEYYQLFFSREVRR